MICHYCGKDTPLEKMNGIKRPLRNNNHPMCYSCLKRNSKFRERYGLNLEKYTEMFNQQEGKCFVCNRHQKELRKALRVDHDHITGNIRKLLCDQCNTAIGLFHENITHMKSAITYLEGLL